MTFEEEIKMLKAALALQGIGINERMADQILVTMRILEKKGDQFTLKDAIEISCEIDRKYKEKELQNEAAG